MRALLAVLLCAGAAQADELQDVYKQLVEINTTHSTGSTTAAAQAMAKRLTDAGFPAADVKVLVPPDRPNKGNLVARLRGSGGRKPLLLLAHLDVVEARREDWTIDPFKLVEKDGYFYGRGTSDDKAMAAIWVETMMKLARAKAPARPRPHPRAHRRRGGRPRQRRRLAAQEAPRPHRRGVRAERGRRRRDQGRPLHRERGADGGEDLRRTTSSR